MRNRRLVSAARFHGSDATIAIDLWINIAAVLIAAMITAGEPLVPLVVGEASPGAAPRKPAPRLHLVGRSGEITALAGGPRGRSLATPADRLAWLTDQAQRAPEAGLVLTVARDGPVSAVQMMRIVAEASDAGITGFRIGATDGTDQ